MLKPVYKPYTLKSLCAETVTWMYIDKKKNFMSEKFILATLVINSAIAILRVSLPIVINVSTRDPVAVKTKSCFMVGKITLTKEMLINKK